MTPRQKPGKEILEEWHNDPLNWKGGIFYFNKNDKRLFPPKRNKSFGRTVNFANPISNPCISGFNDFNVSDRTIVESGFVTNIGSTVGYRLMLFKEKEK